MKKHELLSDRHWSAIRQKSQSNPVDNGDYEEWRANPVTLRLFEEIESQLITAQSELASTFPGDPNIITLQAEVYGKSCVVEGLFSWAPEGIEFEPDDDEWVGNEGEGDQDEY